MKHANISVSLRLRDSNKKPVTGNLIFAYEAIGTLPAGISLKDNGNLDIRGFPKTDKLEIEFHLKTTSLNGAGKDYDIAFKPIVEQGTLADAKDLLWIAANTKPQAKWAGGGGYQDFRHRVDGNESSMSVVIDRSQLGFDTYCYDLAVCVSRVAEPSQLARHDPQIRNGGHGLNDAIRMAATAGVSLLLGFLLGVRFAPQIMELLR